MKKIFILLCMVTFWVAMQANNIVSVQSVTTGPVDELQIEVSLENSDAVTAIEVKIPLDENMTYVDESAKFNTARSNVHIISAAEVDKELRIYIYSLSLKTFKGSEGVLFSLKLKLKKEPAIYTLTPEVVLSNKSGKSIVADVEAGIITILSPKLEFVTQEINFGHVPIHSEYSRTLTVKNIGTSQMNVKSITIPDSRFVVGETEFTIGVGETKSVTIKYSPIKHGAITRQLTIKSDAVNSDESMEIEADPYSVNELHVGKVEGVADSIVSLPLSVKNMEPIVGVQFRFKMPNKLEFDDFELTERTNNYIVLNSQEKDTLSMMLYSISKTPMSGNEGEIGNLKLKLVGNNGYNYLNPVDVVLSNAEEENMVSATSEGWVRIKSPKWNGETTFTLPSASVTSYSSGMYVIQNTGQSPLVIDQITFMSEGFKVASELPMTILAGQEDSIRIEFRASVEDEYSTIMNIYTNDPDNQQKKVMVNCYLYEPNTLSLTGEPAFIKQGEDLVQGYHLNVGMNNYSDIVAMQFDVHWQANMTTDIDYLLSSARLSGHNCSVTKMNNSTYRVLVFSMSNKSIKNKNGTVVTLGYVGTDFKGSIVVDNIILSDAKGKNRVSAPTASMAVKVNKLTVLSNDTTMGSVTGGGYFNRGSKVEISAEAKFGYVFSKWSDGSTDTTRTVTLNGNMTLTAIFLTYMHTVKLSGVNCTVKGAGEFQHGTEIEIEATPKEGYHFVEWSDGDTLAKRNFAILEDMNLTAECAINVYKVELKAENGTTEGAGEYTHGSTVMINAEADTGYHFVKWSDGVTKMKRSIKLISDTTLTAEFAIDRHTVSVTTKNGKVEGVGGYDYGTIVELEAVPEEGYHFVKWGDGDTVPKRSIKLISDTTLTVEFAINIYTVTLSAEKGKVEGAGKYSYGSKVILIANPDEGYHFVRWSDGNTEIEREVIIKEDLNLTAEFAINVYAVQLSVVNGVVSGGGEYEHGSEIIISVTPNEYYHFVGWSDGSTEAIRKIKVVSDSALVAECAIDQFDVTAKAVNGEVLGVGRYDYGSEIELTAQSNTGYHFVRWSDGSTESKRSLTVTSNIYLEAEFEIDVYSVILSAENGEVSGAGDYEYGKAIMLSAVPNEGYHFVGWSDGSTEANRNIVVVGNLTLTAQFALNVYNVVVNAQNATIEGAGKYEHGSSAEVVVIPNEGYHFVGWSDGATETKRQFVVTSDVELEAVIEIDVHTVTLSATDGVVSGAGEYNYGSTATLSAVPNEGYHFVRWSDGDENAVRVITIKGDVDLTAEFVINIYKVSLFAENGEVVGSGEYQHGTEIEMSATANEGYHFVRWSDSDTSSSRVIKVTSDLNLTAIIAINTHVVELNAEHGQVIGAGEYNYGTKLTIMAIADEGYHFVGWSDGDTLMTRTITIVSDIMLTAEFAINVYRVELSANEERGAVLGNGEYEHGEEITIEAIPVEGYHFVKWSDGNGNAKRTFAIKSDITLTAEFAIEIREVVVVAQNGTVTGVGRYEYGTVANLVAEPNDGYHFVGWSDGETSPSRSIVVYEDITLIANFAINVYSVTLSAEKGNVVGGGDYNHGEEVEIEAIPNEGYHFVGWSDGVNDAIRNIIVVSDTLLTAQFAINVYNVELKTNNGEVFGAGSYEHGAEVEIKVIPNEGYHFVRWSDGDEKAIRNIKVVSDTVLTAEMAINVYDVNVFAENGTILGVGKYEYGLDVELEAIPNEGYHFVSWSDGETSSIRNIRVTNDVELTAQFEINVYDVVLTAENAVVVGAGRYEHGDTIVVSCIPNEGYHFVRWSDDNREAEREIVVTEDLNLEAEIAINVYTVALSAENGVVTGAGNYEHGTIVTINAEPNEGYHFIGWSDGETALSRTIKINRDTTLIAKFAINVYSVILSAENGNVVGGGNYNHGEEVEIEAIPNEGYHFVGWSDGVTDAVRTINVTSDITLVAEFAINVYRIELIVENGVVVGAGEYTHGTEIEISVTPNEGYHFVCWSDGSLETTRTIVVVSDTMLSADIDINIYSVELTTEHGVVTGAGEYEHGSRVTIFAVPDEGYHFVGWSDGATDATRTLVLTSDITLHADMSINHYDLILTAENGTITNAGRYEHGFEVEIEAIADEGYHFVRWSDGDTIPTKILTMTTDVTLSAYFAINVYDVVLSVENGVVFGEGRYNHGTEITIAAFADEGHHFVGWSDGDVNMVRTIKVVSDTMLTARFEIEVHRITLSAENGEVFGSGEYAYGTEVELRAVAAKNYHFVGWSDGDVNAVRTVVVNSDLNLHAEFALNKYSVILGGENGEVLGSGEYEYSTVLEIKAEAKEGYHFVRWSDGEENPIRTLVVTSDIELTAEFVIDVYTVVLRAENGIVEGIGDYEYGTEITIRAIPTSGYEFVKWSDGDDRAIRTFVITSDIDLVAEFAKEVREIIVYAENGLVVGAGRYEYGTEAILNAIPNEGYHFVGWSDGVTTAIRTILVDSDTTLRAAFAINVYSVTLVGTNGEVIGSGEYEHGTEIKISATPNEGYYFVGWSDGDTSSVRTITVLSDIELTAKFVSNLYSVVLTCDNGVVLGGGLYEYGAEVTIIATADEGYRFVKWSDGYLLPERKIVVNSDMEFTAEFELKRVLVSVSGENGIVNGSGVYDYGTEVELTAMAEEGYHFVSWSDGNLNSTRTIVATADVNLIATFMINVYSVVLQGNYGKVFGGGNYEHGTEVILTTEPENGYYFVRWSDGDENAIRTLVVTSDTTLVAEFSKEIRSVVVSAENGVVTGGGRYAYGAVAILTAIPNEGYHFVGWSDGVTESVRTIEVLSDTMLTAEFALNVHVVTLRGENGEVEGGGTYEYGSEVEIMAIPNEGYQFVRWSDGDENAVRTIVVTSDTILTAEFSKEVRMVLLYGDNGVVTGSGRYAHGAVVVLTATPNEGYHFVRWSDGVVDAVRTINVTSDITLVAEFAINVYRVELIAENGVVVGAGEYIHGTEVEISVTPNDGYRFVCWSDGETEATRTIVVTSDVSLKAEFAVEVMRVEIEAENAIVVGAGEYAYGSIVTLVVIPNEGYQFVGWSDGETNSTRTINVTSDTLLIAGVTPIIYSIELSGEHGTIIGSGEYEYGSVVEIEAIAEEGYHFVRWSDGVVDAVRTINVTSDITLVAEFAINVYRVELIAENGVVVGAGEYTHGTEVEISVTPNDGYRFVRWSDGETEATRTIVVTYDVILSAEIVSNVYAVILTAENGTFIGDGIYEYGTEITIVAIPNEGYKFVKWSDGITNIFRKIVVTEDVVLFAEFEEIISEVKVYSKGQILYIEGVRDYYYLYDAFGHIVYRGIDNQIFLPHGVYFIKVGWETIKIAL